MLNGPIDLVVTYLENKDESWIKRYEKYKQEEIEKGIIAADNAQAFGIERIRNWDNMQYWFRAVEKNCTWLHKIFFIVQNENQVPLWLDRKNPKLEIVYHKDYIPERLLPTFNTMVIQAFIPRIKNLSDNYIYSDDDNFFLNRVRESMFFRNDLPIHQDKTFWGKGSYAEKMGAWGRNLDNAWKIEKKYTRINIRYAPYHLPAAFNKTLNLKILNDNWDDIYNALNVSKFRNPINVSPSELYFNITKKLKKCIIDNSMYNNCKYLGLDNKIDFSNYNNKTIVCFNDTEKTGDFDMVKKKMQKYLDKRYPVKSSFERPAKDDITLIIPCHNLEKWITPCLDSICAQENKQKINRRAIFICDNCTDRTHEMIEEKMKDSTWKYDIIDAQVGSPGLARNIGLDKANTDYIWFVDGDDWLTCNNAIDEMYRLMKKDDMDIIEFKIKSTKNPDGAFGGGTVWRCVLSSRIIGDMRFNDRQCGEDNDFIWDIYHKQGRKYGKIAMAPYFYNFPREGSQMWKKAKEQEKENK